MPVDDPSSNRSQDQLGKSYFDEFWNDRYKDCRLFGLSITLIVFVGDVENLIRNKNFNAVEEKFLYIYITIYLVALSIFFYSFKEGVDLRIIMIPMILITTKFEIRFLNFEDIGDPNKPVFRNKLDKETF